VKETGGERNLSAQFSMEKYYVISGLNPELDGFYVQGEECDDLLEVSKIFYGQSQAFSIPRGSIYLFEEFYQEAPDFKEITLSGTSDYGKFLFEGTMEVSGLRVAYSQFERTLQVSVIQIDGNKTLYTENFFDKIEEVKQEIEHMLKSGSDIHDLIFRLRDFKELEDGKTKEGNE
jgi:hypothetical protein